MVEEKYIVVINYQEPNDFDKTGDPLAYDELAFSSDQSDVYVYNTLELANEHIISESYGDPNLDSDYMKIFHGMLVSANFIPETFNGCTPFLMVRNPIRSFSDLHKHEAYFKKISSGAEVLAKIIEEIMTYSVYGPTGEPNGILIGDISIFLGYELQTALYCPTTGSDEEAIFRINKLAKKMMLNRGNILNE